MKLADCKLTLGDIDLGTVDAESDRKLGQYFITTPQAKAAVKLRKTQFLGRKGAGKSALFRSSMHYFKKQATISPESS